MSTFLKQLKWQFVLLQKNNIINISIAVTAIYGIILYFIKSLGNLDVLLITLVLNDPSIIGCFFIALSIFSEIKNDVLSAVFTTPISPHQYLITRTIALSVIGLLCSLGLAISVKGLDFGIFPYAVGATGICVLSAFLGIIILTYASDFLKFALLTLPFFIFFIIIPMMHYLKVIDLGFFQYIFPVQGSIDLIENGISGKEINEWYAYLSIVIWAPLFYYVAYRMFNQRIVRK
jgi:fluoroquinolone transport system permease protein